MNKMMKYPQRKTPSVISTILASPQGVTLLEEVVSIIRPRSTLAVSYQRGSDLVSAFQIGAKGINCTGFLPKPDNFDVIQLPETVNRDEFLRPYDVLMVTSGQRIGDVSIAPPETPKPEAGGWVVGGESVIDYFACQQSRRRHLSCRFFALETWLDCHAGADVRRCPGSLSGPNVAPNSHPRDDRSSPHAGQGRTGQAGRAAKANA